MRDPNALKPYDLVRLAGESPTLQEVISYPYPEQGIGELVMVRDPGDPTTIQPVLVSRLTLQSACCPRDQSVFRPVVRGEFKNTHVDCPTCGRGYYANHNEVGVPVNFECEPGRLLVLNDSVSNS